MIEAGIVFLLVFPGGAGTADMLRRAKNESIPYKVYEELIPSKV